MIRVLLAHASRELCASLRSALDQLDDIYVAGCAFSAEELLFLLPHAKVVMIGTELRRGNTLDTIRKIRLIKEEIKVLVMGVEPNPDMILQYVEAGASGYVLLNEPVEDMVAKVRAAHEERAIVSPSMAAALMAHLAELASLGVPIDYMENRKRRLDKMTMREREVLTLIANEHTNQEIAETLVIEYGTVKNHVHNILAKLEVRNRHEAASIFQMQ